MLFDLAVSALGVLVVLVVLRDFVITTLRLEGSGMVSRWLMATLWLLARQIQRRRPHRPILAKVGVLILLGNIFAWVLLLWLGWLLLFLPHTGSILESSSRIPADFWSNVYFVGYSLITLGVGDYVPNGPLFQVATVLASMSGFFLFTLSVTYLVPVVGAIVQARQLAAQTLLLGRTPSRMVTRALTTGGSGYQQLTGLAASIILLLERHFAYPVLTYFPSSERGTSTAVALAVLDESLTLLLCGVREEERVPRRLLEPLRDGIAQYLERHVAAFEDSLPPSPPPPSLLPVEESGVEAVDREEFEERMRPLERRRAMLRALLVREGREWDEVGRGEV